MSIEEITALVSNPIPNPRSKDRFCSREYRKWLTTQTCVGCRGFGSDPHHTISRKWAAGSDALCIPLCRGCHRLIHDHVLELPSAELEIVRLQAKFLREEFGVTVEVFTQVEFETMLREAGYSQEPFTQRKNRKP